MKQKGFSLVELLIVVTVIGIIAALAVPNLIAARRYANEGSAISSLKTIQVAQETFQTTAGAGNFGDLTDLASTQAIDDTLGIGNKSGYIFLVTQTDRSALNPAIYDATAIAGTFGNTIIGTGSRNFYTNESGVLYQNRAGQNSPPSATSATDRTVVNGAPIDG